MGGILSRQNNYREAINYYDKAINLACYYQNKYSEMMILYYQIYAFKGLGEYDTAIEKANECLQIAQEIGDFYRKGWVNFALGGVYRNQGKLELARQHFEERLRIMKRLGNKLHIAFALNDLASFIELYEHRMIEAAGNYELSLEIRKEIGYPIVRALGDWAGVIGKLGQFDEALPHLNFLLKTCRQRNDLNRVRVICSQLGRIYFAYRKFQCAIEYTAEAFWISCEQQIKSEISSNSLLLAQCYIEIGSIDKVNTLINQIEPYKKGWQILYTKALLSLYEKNYSDAVKLIEEAISLYYKPGQEDKFGVLNKDLTIAYMHTGNLDKALTCALETSSYYEYSGEWNVAEAYLHLTRVYLARNDFMNAERYLSVAKKKFDEEYKLPHRFAECKVYEGQMLKMQSKTEEGNKIIRESIKKFEEIGAVRLQRDAEDILNNY